ncbi:hypothetical protein Tco_0711967, partial [Tanacetum coccineum]
ADGAQSSRVPVPLPKDPYEAIRQAYLDGMDTESEPFEDPIDTETPESPLTRAPPTSLHESTPPTLIPILRRTARMAVRVPPAISSGLSTSMAEVAAMSESAFRKRFSSSYESSPTSSSPDLPSWKRYQGTSELVEDSEEDDDEEDKEIEESLDNNSVSEDVEDDGPTAKDEDPAARDDSLATRDEGLEEEEEEEEVVPGGQQQAAPVVGTAMSSGSAPESERPERVSVSRQPTLTTWTDQEDGGLIRDHAVRLEELQPTLFKRYDKDIGELFTRSRAVKDEIFSQREPGFRLHLAEERRARLELVEVIDSMRRGQEPRGDA